MASHTTRKSVPGPRKSVPGPKVLVFGTIAAATTLAGCQDSGPPAGDFAFTNVAQCEQAGFERTACQAKLEEAVALHKEKAPRFSSRAACEAEFGEGNCGGAQNAQGSFFTPFLAGFLVSQMVANRAGNAAAARAGNGFAGGPIYRGRGGQPVAIPPSARGTAGAVRPTALNPGTQTARRSGFGSRATTRARTRGFGG